LRQIGGENVACCHFMERQCSEARMRARCIYTLRRLVCVDAVPLV
jgi:hypothetical protein